MSRKLAFVVLMLVLVMGVAIRVYRLEDRSLWYDEAFSYVLVHDFTWGEMIQALRQDVHPPFYFVSLRLWVACFGISIYSLRGFSVVMGAVTLLGIYLFTRDLYVYGSRTEEADRASQRGREAGISASAILAVFSSHIWWSQDAKMYSLATAIIAFNAWFLVRGLAGGNWKWWVGYAFSAAAMLYTHNYALFTFVGECAFLVAYFLYQSGLSPRKLFASTTFRQASLAVIGASCLYLPWVPTLLMQSKRVKADYWITPAGAWAVPHNLDLLFFPGNSFSVPNERAIALLVVLLGVMAGLLYQRRGFGGLLVALAVTPVLCAVIVSSTFASIMTPRYFLFAALFVPSMTSVLMWHNLPKVAWGGALLLVGNLTAVHFQFLDSVHLNDRGAVGAINHLMENHKPDQPVIVTHAAVYFTVKYYAGDKFTPKLLVSSKTIPHYLGGAILRDVDKITEDELNCGNDTTIWVVDSTGFGIVPAARSTMPKVWSPVMGTRVEFREVFDWQGDVSSELFRRRKPEIAIGVRGP